MSYQPPPEQPGGPPPGPPPGGPPPGPPPGGTPTTNIPPQGGYTPPPPGGYTPPPPGGYTPPPPGGGYGAPPPPPPPTGGGMGGMGGGGSQIDFQDLLQGYMGAVTTPTTAFYESQIPKSNVLKILIGLGIVIVVNIIVGLISAGAAAASLAPLRDQLRAQGINFDPTGMVGGAGAAGVVSNIILTPITFFLGAAILFGLARMLGGQGGDFMTHSYLLHLSYVPLGVVSSVLGLIPAVGSLVALVALLYRQYSQGKSMEASQRMQSSRALIAAYLPLLIGIVLFCLCILLAIMGLAAAFSGAANTR